MEVPTKAIKQGSKGWFVLFKFFETSFVEKNQLQIMAKKFLKSNGIFKEKVPNSDYQKNID